METVTVRIYSNENEEERIVRIEKKYLELLDMVYCLVDCDDLFDYKTIDDLRIADFTK